jgi:hypothetical protein
MVETATAVAVDQLDVTILADAAPALVSTTETVDPATRRTDVDSNSSA